MQEKSDMKELATLVHEIVIQLTGGTAGIRYDADLERVYDPIEAAKVIAHHHPFVDGNKRTAYVMWKLAKVYGKWTWEEFEGLVEKIIEEDRVWLDILSKI